MTRYSDAFEEVVFLVHGESKAYFSHAILIVDRCDIITCKEFLFIYVYNFNSSKKMNIKCCYLKNVKKIENVFFSIA